MYAYDPITCLERLGYTSREACFLYPVGRNSGYFLRRQFLEFAQGKAGALAQNFVTKALANGHISALDYGQRRHLYHLRSCLVYAILEMENTRHRRAKGDHEIATRLLVLDYSLGQLEQRWLSTEAEKTEFFEKELQISPEHFPQALGRASSENPTGIRYFPDHFPVAAIQQKPGSKACIRFTYFDAGMATVTAFERYLRNYRELFLRLSSFELVFVAVSSSNFLEARRLFERMILDPTKARRLLPHGPEHLSRYFTAQDLWERNDSSFTGEDLLVMKEGERIYMQPEHTLLRAAWRNGRVAFEQELSRLGMRRAANGRFTTHMVQKSYPIFGYKKPHGVIPSAVNPPFYLPV